MPDSIEDLRAIITRDETENGTLILLAMSAAASIRGYASVLAAARASLSLASVQIEIDMMVKDASALERAALALAEAPSPPTL